MYALSRNIDTNQYFSFTAIGTDIYFHVSFLSLSRADVLASLNAAALLTRCMICCQFCPPLSMIRATDHNPKDKGKTRSTTLWLTVLVTTSQLLKSCNQRLRRCLFNVSYARNQRKIHNNNWSVTNTSLCSSVCRSIALATPRSGVQIPSESQIFQAYKSAQLLTSVAVC